MICKGSKVTKVVKFHWKGISRNERWQPAHTHDKLTLPLISQTRMFSLGFQLVPSKCDSCLCMKCKEQCTDLLSYALVH
eukprot:568419-Prorocentrum_minimum.AAC.2